LSAGLDLADLAGTALIPTVIAKPVISAVTNGLRQLNVIERRAFNRHIASFNMVLDSDPTQLKKLLDCFACMVLAHFVHAFKEYELSLNTANDIIDVIVDFIGFGHTSLYPLLEKNEGDTYSLKKIDRLMYQLFESPQCYFVTTANYWSECLDALEKGVSIEHGKKTSAPFVYGTFHPNHIHYRDASLNPALAKIEQHVRQALLNALDDYHKKYRDVGYYGRYFLQYVRFHGGDESFEKARKLEKDIKSITFPALLQNFSKFLNETHQGSRMDKYSLNSLIIDLLVGNMDSDSLDAWDTQMQRIVESLEPERMSIVSEAEVATERESLLSRGSLFSGNHRKMLLKKVIADLQPFENEHSVDESTVALRNSRDA
jgi:hypothetical protein